MDFELERIGKILKDLKEHIHIDKRQIKNYLMKECSYGSYDLLQADDTNWQAFSGEDYWGGKDAHCWFRMDYQIPQEFDKKTVAFNVTTGSQGWDALNPQFMIFVNGTLVQGLDINHAEIFLADSAKVNDIYRIDLYAYSGMNEGRIHLFPEVSALMGQTEKLYYHIQVPFEVASLLAKDDKRRLDIIKFLTNALNLLDLRKPLSPEYYASIEKALSYLDSEFYDSYCGNDEIIELCVGHTHIDVAWLWTLSQTREKAVRSFSTVVNLMKRYPEYTFMSSQPQLYQFVKEDQPALYEEIRELIAAGRWEAEGAMWLEADCNLISGESMVRQLLFGTRFMRNEFGVESKVLWLPDVFGYSAALPQILQKSGIEYFMTTKISWNQTNTMPYDTFLWKGLDGTEILTYFVTTRDYNKDGQTMNFTTYNGDINGSQVMGCWQRYQQKDINTEVMNCFGYGDGGGGPTRNMIEHAQRFSKGIPGAPKVQMGKSLDFFHRLEERVKDNKKLPSWVGELYLEYHRGTYTSMARNKKYNRKTEFLNIDAELFSSMNSTLLGAGYPQKQLNDCWQTTLLNQFHDIIPGSSIQEVYEESQEQYKHIQLVGTDILTQAIADISANIAVSTVSAVVFNQLSFTRSSIVELALPQDWASAKVFDNGKELAVQPVQNGSIIFYAEDVPAKGYRVFELRKSDCAAESLSSSQTTKLSNKFFDIHFDDNANITSIYDVLNQREVLKDGNRANVLQAFEDKPFEYDAWNIESYYTEKMWEINDIISTEVVECGPVRWALSIKKKFLDSTIEQVIYLYEQIARIDFETVVDWKENQILLKAAFPVDIHAEKATYEIQYGNVERTTHWNTGWDRAQFEVCGHKWADISEDDYGVSLLNDCKYGYDIKDSVMRLTLLKSPIYPNPLADKEIHRFTYSLYPHSSTWKNAQTAQMAYDINCPLLCKIEQPHEGNLPQAFSFVSINQDNIMVETVKKAEDSDSLIVRLYEYKNRRTKAKCTFYKDIASAAECNLMEIGDEAVPIENDSISFTMNPYEIKTFKITLK